VSSAYETDVEPFHPPAASSPGVRTRCAAFGGPRSSDDEEKGGISRRSRTSQAGFVDLLPTVGGDVASHEGIEPSLLD
jgi:hypothetical protein